MPIIQVAEDENRQLQNIANVLASSKKIVMITGAGISTNCGIPDFRSEDGLYALIQSHYDKGFAETHRRSETSWPNSVPAQGLKDGLPTNVKGKDLFDARIWNDPMSTSVFYTFIASLRRQIKEEVKQTTPTHRFIRTMRDSRKLVRCYTQNIDGLESRLGLCMDLDRGKGNRSRFAAKSRNTPRVLTKPAPGDNMDGGCETCGWEEKGREVTLLRGKAPECFACALSDQQRRDRGKRGTKVGSLRPNIVLYGEEHPAADAVGSITAHDLSLAPDVLLILGTSLHVQGVRTLVKEFARCVHARPKARGKVIFVNLSRPSESIWKDSIDYWVSMDCDAWIGSLRRHRPDIWQFQTELKARIAKKDVQRLTKVSTPTKSKVADKDKTENVASTSSSSLPSPHRRTPGRPRSKPLAEIKSNEEYRIKGQNRQATSSPDSKRDETPSQLPTPPPSGHKHSAREQGQKQVRDWESPEEPTMPSRRARFIAQPKQELSSFKRSWAPEGTQHQLSPSKRRKLEVEIWED
ncbi:MAG: hypothetical protein Q9225_001170 [Loekoesia sp. 1 TL-2023]